MLRIINSWFDPHPIHPANTDSLEGDLAWWLDLGIHVVPTDLPAISDHAGHQHQCQDEQGLKNDEVVIIETCLGAIKQSAVGIIEEVNTGDDED